MMSLGRQGFPKKLHINHKYVEKFAITVASGVSNYQLFHTNGMYDPNHSIGGHQPIGFDEVSGLYNHYHVMRAKMTVELTPSSTPVFVAVSVEDDSAAPSGIYEAGEQATASVSILPNTAVKPLTITKSWDAKHYFGGDILDNDSLKGNSSSNPSELCYFCIFTEAVDGVSGYNLFGLVKIEYDAIWTEVRTFNQS